MRRKPGRPSAADLAVAASNVTGFDRRPAPPEKLTQAEQEIWTRIVRRMPDDFFAAEQHGLLAEYCRRECHSDWLAKQLETMRNRAQSDITRMVEVDDLAKQIDREVKSMGSLATKLRLTNQSRFTAEKAATKAKAVGSGSKPWE